MEMARIRAERYLLVPESGSWIDFDLPFMFLREMYFTNIKLT
jgi:hypothetical protein